MKANHSPRRSGRSRHELILLLALSLIGGCSYGFTGGGGFPAHIQSVYVAPFENETIQFGLEQQIFTALVDELPGQLDVQVAGRQNAEAILRGRITRYSDVAQNFRTGSGTAGPQVVSHQVQLGVAVEIVDVVENVILWESSGVTGQASYQPGSQSDRAAIQQAVQTVVRKIIDGAQSRW